MSAARRDVVRAAPAHHATVAARLGRFVLERFPPLSYGTLILALVVGGAAAGSLASGTVLSVDAELALIALAVACALLQLRIIDEIRDVALDRIGRPERPLPRGLVTVRELRLLAVASAFVGGVVSTYLGPLVVVAYGLVLAMTWLVGWEPARRSLQPHGVLGYALRHSIVVPATMVPIWVAIGAPLTSGPFLAQLLLVWGASLGMEIGRKTVRPDEERLGIETYSREVGRRRALELAALSFSAGCIGAGVLAIMLGAPSSFTLVPFAAAIAVPSSASLGSEGVGTGIVRSVSAVLVLVLLSWPLVVALGIA